jgi:excisionase family DNA binding protein
MPATKTLKKQTSREPVLRVSEVLDVETTAQFLTVSTDTVYDLFKSGELPGRKVGRKWITTRAAVLRWIQSSAEEHSLARAISRGDGQALQAALNSGKAQIGKRK